MPEAIGRALASEVSGAAAKHTVQELTLFHHMMGSRGLRGATEVILRRAREGSLEGVGFIQLPADGVVCYGTQRPAA